MRKFFYSLILIPTSLFAAPIVEWEQPPVVLSQVGFAASGPEVVADSRNGHAIAVWSEAVSASTSRIFYSLYNGTSWSGQLPISSEFQTMLQPDIAINTNTGGAIAVWPVFDGVDRFIQAALFNGTSWAAPGTITNPATTQANGPRIALNSTNGQALTIWSNSSGGNSVQGSLFNGSSWSIEQNVSRTTDTASGLQIAYNTRLNRAIAVWSQTTGSEIIRAAVFNGTSWQAPFTLSTGGTNQNPQIAIDSEHNLAMVVWEHTEMLNQVIQASFFNGTSWGVPITLSAAMAGDPEVAFNTISGKAFAVWSRFDGANDVVESRVFNGTAWEATKVVPGNADTSPDLVVDSLHDLAIVLYVSSDGMVNEIRSSIFTNNAWQTPTLVANEESENPQIAAAIDELTGTLFGVWESPPGRFSMIHASVGHITNLPPPPPPPPPPNPQPHPPTNLAAKKLVNRFLNRIELINRLSWTASTTKSVVSYNIYRDGKLIGNVAATSFTDLVQAGVTYLYAVTAVGADKIESLPIKIIVKN